MPVTTCTARSRGVRAPAGGEPSRLRTPSRRLSSLVFPLLLSPSRSSWPTPTSSRLPLARLIDRPREPHMFLARNRHRRVGRAGGRAGAPHGRRPTRRRPEHRGHRLGARERGARPAHDAGSGVLLRRHGPGEERPQHDDDELRRHRARQRPLGPLRLLDVLRRRLAAASSATSPTSDSRPPRHSGAARRAGRHDPGPVRSSGSRRCSPSSPGPDLAGPSPTGRSSARGWSSRRSG